MRFLVLGVSALLLIAADVSFAGSMCATGLTCCTNSAACCKTAACCRQTGAASRIDGRDLPIFPPGSEWREPDAVRPVREYARVEFRDPVKVGDKLLYGTYVIEHDTERMARGEPCTHIYKMSDRRVPVVAFHCTHLTREKTDHATVRLRRLPDPSTKMYELVEFQFENEADAHGVPGLR